MRGRMRGAVVAALIAIAALAALNLGLRAQLGNDMAVEPAFQGDYREAVCVMGGKARSVHSSGCGAVCAYMAIRHLVGIGAPDPQALFQAAYERGDYAGDGLGHEALSAMLRENGVRGSWIGRSEWRVKWALRAGQPVIAHMGKGTFTDGGHYILLTGITPEGLALVNDPGSRARTGQAYDLSLILDEAKTAEPFCICR